MTTDAQPKTAASAVAASSSSSSTRVSTPDLLSSSHDAAVPTATRPAAFRSKHSRTASSISSTTKRRTSHTPTTDFLSDRATEQLIRRVLCPQQTAGDRGTTPPQPLDELLPPLTSRNDVDLQLYAIIAIVLRDFVQTWYNKITPDEAFVAEIVHIIAHCTRALEQRLRKVDLESLLLDELPDLLDQHVLGW